MMRFVLPFLAAQVWAGGLLESYDEETAQYAICQRSERDAAGDEARVVGVWKACLAEAERRQLNGIVPEVRGNLALAAAQFDASRMSSADEEQKLEYILTQVAEQRGVKFRLEALAEVFRRYLATSRGRSRMESYRDLRLRWTNRASLPEEGLGQVAEVVQRFTEDAGLRWREDGTQAAVSADLLVDASVRADVQAPGIDSLDSSHTVRVALNVEKLRLRNQKQSLQGFNVHASAQGRVFDDALSAAVEQASSAMASELLQAVIRAAFETPVSQEEYLDPYIDYMD